MHQIDFKDLGDILFKTYQKGSVWELYDKIDGSENLEDLDLEDLRTYVPKSNWERYFSSIVACDDIFLKKRWEDLYDLRCMVAHNALVTKTEYENIEKLVQEVQEKLQKAIDNLDKIEVPEEDKEELAESVASNLNVLYGNFIQSWKLFEVDLEKIVNYLGLDLGSAIGLKSPYKTIQLLHKNAVIDDEMLSEAKDLMQFRNKLVHDPTISLGEQEISDYIVRQKDFIDELKKLASDRSTWKNELVNALRNLGGKASLSEIYDYIEQNTVRELPKTWKATVRYTLQLNSSDTETYSRGGEDLFERLERGIWSLKKGVEENDNRDNDGEGEETGESDENNETSGQDNNEANEKSG